LLEYLCMHGGF